MWNKRKSAGKNSTSYKVVSTCLVLALTAATYLFQVQQNTAIQHKIRQGSVSMESVTAVEFTEFRVGVIKPVAVSEAGANEENRALQKLEDYLNSALPYEVEVLTFSDYSDLVAHLDYGKIQLALLGPTSYAVAHERSGARAIAALSVAGKAEHFSYLITHIESPWNSLNDFLKDDLSEHSLALSDIFSLSGALVPLYELRALGVYTDFNNHHFKEIILSGSDEATGRAVEQKEVDAGLLDSNYYELLADQGLLDEGLIKVIWRSNPLYYNPWTVSYQVDPKTIKRLQTILTQINDSEILGLFDATGFVKVTDEDYDFVREIMPQIDEATE